MFVCPAEFKVKIIQPEPTLGSEDKAGTREISFQLKHTRHEELRAVH